MGKGSDQRKPGKQKIRTSPGFLASISHSFQAVYYNNRRLPDLPQCDFSNTIVPIVWETWLCCI